MRIDLFLKKSRLIKQRENAKKTCDRGQVHMDGRPVKPSRNVQIGDHIIIELLNGRLEVEVVEIPLGNVSKARSRELYRLISSENLTEDDLFEV